ncbi:MAG TPA: gamma-glutamylcyclotransferase family protein [Syntrophobacteria bacterium]|nr:gamma-glutamylcyclotransferase family protein [Syntrophobacteria bacterium]
MMIYYFAYGSNMDSSQMARICPSARVSGIGILSDYRFIVNQRGLATVVPETGKKVYGVVWALAEGDLANLDDYEDVAGGLYSRVPAKVTLMRGAVSNAFIYVAANDQPGSPGSRYVEAIVAAATRHGFPEPYINELRMWLEEK